MAESKNFKIIKIKIIKINDGKTECQNFLEIFLFKNGIKQNSEDLKDIHIFYQQYLA